MSVFNKDKLNYDDTKAPYYYNSRDIVGQNDTLAHQYLQKNNYNGLNVGSNNYNNGVPNLPMQSSRIPSIPTQTMSQSRNFNDTSLFGSGLGLGKPITNPQGGMNLSNSSLGLYNQQQQSSNIIQRQQQQTQRNPSSSSLSMLNPTISSSSVSQNPNNNSFDNSNFPMLSSSSSGSGNMGSAGGGSSQLLHSHTISRSSNIIGTSSHNSNSINNAFSNNNLLQLNSRGPQDEDFTMEHDDFPALPGGSSSNANLKSSNENLTSTTSGSSSGLVHNAFMTRDIALINNGTVITGKTAVASGGTSLTGGVGDDIQDSGSSQMFGSSNISGFGNITSLLQNNNTVLSVTPDQQQSNQFHNSGAGSMTNSFTAGTASNSSNNSGGLSGLNNNSKEYKFGLIGLLEIIRISSDKNENALALGTDLTTFGLNLNSSDTLYPTFSSPFTDHTLTPDPEYHTPSCYMMHPPSLKAEHLSKFQIETLFYMFYSMPKDLLQAYSAQELYRRDWRYHGELKLWLKPRAPLELMQSHPSVQFVYFDCHTWETRLFTASTYSGRTENITVGLLNEDEIRVPPTGGGGGGGPL